MFSKNQSKTGGINNSFESASRNTYRFIKSIVSFIFPPKCAGCGRPQTFLCEQCLARLPRCLDRREENIVSVFDYRDPIVKKCVHLLKYRGAREIAAVFGHVLHEALLEGLGDELSFHPPFGKIILTPVPLSGSRRRERGFNQAEEIAKQMAELDPKSYELPVEPVIKIKETPTQVSVKNREKRLLNLREAFALAKSPSDLPQARHRGKNRNKFWRGRTVIIVDDVSTTGATIREIEKLLKKAGVARVYGMTVAH